VAVIKCLLVVVLLVVSALGQTVLPPSGLYLSLSNVALSSSAVDISGDLMNEVNQYTAWPPESGSSSSASYTFQNWKVAIALVAPQWKVIGTNELAIGWKEFNFTIEADYHVCSTSWPNPCEDGNLYIYTTDTHTQLFIDVVMDLDLSPPFVNVTASTLSFTNNGIEIYVQCTNTFCLIPVDDIAQAVADNFVTVFTGAVGKAAETALLKHIASFKTEFTFADGLALDLRNNWWILPGNTGGENGLIFVPSSGGFYTDVAGAENFPPFPPAFTPPQSYLQWPNQDIDIVITEYFFQSLTWSLAGLKFFDKTITSSEVPSSSPVQLNTADQFFQQVVPGLTQFPHMDLTVTTTLVSVSIPTIDTAGLHVDGTNITMEFSLSNSSYSHAGWTLSVVFNVDMWVNATIPAAGNTIMFNSSITNFTAEVEVVSSAVGNVTASGFATLFQLLESVVKAPGFVMKLPSSFTASNPSLTFFSQYIGFGADFGMDDAEYPRPPSSPLSPSSPVIVAGTKVNIV